MHSVAESTICARVPHAWDLSPKEAVQLQESLRHMVVCEKRVGAVHTVAGIDISTAGGQAHAAVAVLHFPELELLETSQATLPLTFPYIPGLLSFREGPAILQAMAGLRCQPDLLIFDGQGLAHPRRMGLASHLGVVLDRPSIGCAKSRLCGEHAPVGEQVGDWQPLQDKGEVIGAVLRTRQGVKPVYVSIGHRVDLQLAMQSVLSCTMGYRLPEPIRCAHQLAGGASAEMLYRKHARRRTG